MDLGEYLETLEAHAEANDPEANAKESDPDWLAGMMARRVGEEAGKRR